MTTELNLLIQEQVYLDFLLCSLAELQFFCHAAIESFVEFLDNSTFSCLVITMLPTVLSNNFFPVVDHVDWGSESKTSFQSKNDFILT